MDTTDTQQTPSAAIVQETAADTSTQQTLPYATVQDAPEPQQPEQPNIADLYALDSDPESAADSPAPDAAPEQEYSIAWPEDFTPTDTLSAWAHSAAKDAGLDPAAAGTYTAAMVKSLQAEEQRLMAESHAAMQKEWGANFETNLSAAKNMLRQLKSGGFVDDHAIQLLQSPRGMKLLHGLSSFVGERPAAGTKASAPADTTWAHEVMHNPSHPDYHAFHNSSDPRWREVNSRYNGIRFGSR